MKSDFFSYLDGFNLINILVPEKLENDHKKFSLENESQTILLTIQNKQKIGREIKYSCSINDNIFLNQNYMVYDEGRNQSFLRTGSIVRTELFDMMYDYDQDDLGVTFTDGFSTFKLWSPVAKEIELELIDLKGIKQFIDLRYHERGVWSLTVFGNLEGYQYRYRVRVNETFNVTTDPYAIASTANGVYNYVVDPSRFSPFSHDKPEFSGRKVDAIIYELSVRDYTISKTSKAIHKGLYEGLYEDLENEGINHIKDLGITHIQLMPVYDFEGTDELDKDKLYNWGYNPSQYNVPEGWFSKNPDDAYERINELRQLVDAYHAKGIRVNMDVVYNHVYDMGTFPFEKIVPGYFYRFDSKGIRTEVSGCGNDIASERPMMQRFILNSIKWWMNTYQIDGFRFDLMGLLDIETMNKIDALVKSIDPAAFVYGEGWMMQNTLPDSKRSHMGNQQFMPYIAHFNDAFREQIKGGTFSNSVGFAMGGKVSNADLFYLFTGSAVDQFRFFNPNQSINYIECHDNHTFYDRANLLLKNPTNQQIKEYARLGLALTILSQGVPFIHAGQEFLRSKRGVENSYKSPDSINEIDWTLKDEHMDLVSSVKDLIEIRKQYKLFRLRQVTDIKQSIRIVEQSVQTSTVQFVLTGFNQVIKVFFKNSYTDELLPTGDGFKCIFDGTKKTNEIVSHYLVNKPGAYLFVKEV
ncbi:MAG: type I pullulanase [Acholeplasma sp.]|nr:type I pullulanase [Acholeplasma sp.]